MIYIKGILKRSNREADDFLEWLENENLPLTNVDGEELVKIKPKGRIYADLKLIPYLKRYLDEIHSNK
jgi:hypothetical protein